MGLHAYTADDWVPWASQGAYGVTLGVRPELCPPVKVTAVQS